MKPEIAQELRDITKETTELSTPIKTLKDIKVELIDYTKNPYKMMANMILQTWTSTGNKWSKMSPELRFEVVKGALDKRGLPLAMEAPWFNFQIQDVSRAAFDQIARTRYGVVFSSKGFKDDNLHDTGFMMPSHIMKDPALVVDVMDHITASKELYEKIIEKGHPNWAARCVMSIYSLHNFNMGINFFSLQAFCANRMQTTEMEDTVATAWLMREKVKDVFPLLANYLRPACDWSKKDTTAAVNGFADEIGVPHISDDRQPGFDPKKYPEINWNEPCTDIKIIEKECGITIPGPSDWINYTWETLDEKDKKLFEEN